MAEFVLRRLLCFSLLVTVSAVAKNCTVELLESCKQKFQENSEPSCGEVVQLAKCLQDARSCDTAETWVKRHSYRTLKAKLNSQTGRCYAVRDKERYNQCNETQARRCYNEFDVNATFICPEVRRLKLCVSKLSGCHIMRHPSFAMSHKVLEDHSKCFVNYSIILEALKSRKSTEKRQETTQSSSTTAVNSTNSSALKEDQPSTSYLPYTFVVVATVCTCLFLIVLVIFSIVRHTMLTRRQRNSAIERVPTRIRIRSRHSSRHRTRPYHHHRHRSQRRHMYVISGARQTVTGFFEGNVPPPPYNSVLDDNESLRASDPPPPYRPPSFVAIGVIV